MAAPANAFISSPRYNAIPHIADVAGAPKDHAKDLADLRGLLAKHNVPEEVCIRLIHTHFDTLDGEVMVFDKLSLPQYGIVQIMKPIAITKISGLKGIDYLVNSDGLLEAYEYTSGDNVLDMSAFEPFLNEFCRTVSERGLQNTFGLKIKGGSELDNVGWTEFEIHEKRSTVMLQEGMPMPEGEFDFSVATEWSLPDNIQRPRTCKHSTICRHGASVCKHCKHCNNHVQAVPNANGLSLGGHEVIPGSVLYNMVSSIVAAC